MGAAAHGSEKLAAIIAVITLSAGCSPLPKPAAKAPPAVVHVANMAGPDGAPLAEACTPTGPELCFNAVDDNCNGVIDEGCGEGTADVNLVVTIPGQERIPNRTGSTPPGFQFGGDCPGNNRCGGQNIENVYFDGLEPPRGHYTVEIALADLHGDKPPVEVRFGARLGGRTLGFGLALSPFDAAKKTFTFDVQ
jgi:hypothetical protein